MALQPSLRSLVIAGRYDAPHTIDAFLDYVCPFSAKLALALEELRKSISSSSSAQEGENLSNVKIIIRLQVQPWHASSVFTHEAALAVSRVSPESFWPFSLLLFKNQADYFDIPSSTLTPLQIREKLAGLAAQVIPNKIDEFKELLELKSTPNGGVDVTDDLKYNVKFSRQNGIHVSPTVLWDGLVANEIDSSWNLTKWSQFLRLKATV